MYKVFDTVSASFEECMNIRNLLTEGGINYESKETGTILFKSGGYFVNSEKDYLAARNIIDDYQQTRKKRFSTEAKKKSSSNLIGKKSSVLTKAILGIIVATLIITLYLII